VNVAVNTESLKQSERGAILGEIFVNVGQDQFPESNWNDFVVVVLTWWCTECAALLRGTSQAELSFMDGPFFLDLQALSKDEWSVRFLRHRYAASPTMVESVPASGLPDGLRIRPGTFVSSVASTSDVVLTECGLRGWITPEVDELKRGLELLRSYL